ncbi:MAG: hypothetical protein EP336_18025 [Rhodobacteraceae bacterium]|nr:MAG: hypothetical protein EP336_18025 [Paracoccaceae bacterium]
MRVSAYKLMLSLLILMVFALTAARAGGLLGPLYFIVSLGIGVWTLLKSPTRHYISFTMLLWMFSPFVRRLVDWQSGRHDYSLALLAPLAVTLLAVFALPRRMSRPVARLAAPFFLSLLVVFWGLLLGLANGRAIGAVYAAVTWGAPIGFGLFIVTRPREVQGEIREVLGKTMIAGGAIMALYGIYQFVVAPAWDVAWMQDAEMNSIGAALPFSIRVFSTSNSPGTFAVVLSAAILVSFTRLSPRVIAADAVMVLALALSLVRSSWGATALGILLLMVFGTARVKFRVVLIVGLVTLAAVPLLMRSEFFDAISSRFETLMSIEDDRSLQARRDFSNTILDNVGVLIVGQGLGSTGLASNLTGGTDVLKVFDNGWLDLVFTFGAVSALLISTLLFWLYRLTRIVRTNPSGAPFAVIPIILIAELIFANILTGTTGMFLFPFLGAALASSAPRRVGRGNTQVAAAEGFA